MKKQLLAIITVLALCISVFVACSPEVKGTEGLDYYLLPDGTYGVAAGHAAYLEEIVIPEEYNGKPVTQILLAAFYVAPNLKKLSIPSSITKIYDSSFLFAGNDATIEYNEHDNAYYLGNESNPYVVLIKAKSRDIISCEIHPDTKLIYSEAFENCYTLAELKLPDGLVGIGASAFSSCRELKEISIPDGVAYIGSGAFASCAKLKSVNIPSSLTKIDTQTFYGCSDLEQIVIPDSVTSIGVNAFCHCSDLKSVTIGNGVKSIGESAFIYCTSLTEINIPQGVTSINIMTFIGCTSLSFINYGGTVAQAKALSNSNGLSTDFPWYTNGLNHITVICSDGVIEPNDEDNEEITLGGEGTVEETTTVKETTVETTTIVIEETTTADEETTTADE